VPPRDVDAAVNVVDALMEYKSSPLDAMRSVSQALDAFPALQIDKINWATSGDPAASLSGNVGGGGGVSDPAQAQPADASSAGMATAVAGEDGKTYLYYQIAEIDGHLAPFAGDYRQAIATVEQFRDALQRAAKAYKVEIVRQPLDVSSEGSLQGEADQKTQELRADFSVRLVLGVEGDNEKG
jgi:hypothetical protein